MTDLVVSINGQKVDSQLDVSAKLPAEVLSLLNNMQGMMPAMPATPAPAEDIKTKITQTMPIDINNPVKDEIRAYLAANEQQNTLVRSRPEFIERALVQKNILEQLKKENDSARKMTIFEEGVALGIVVGQSDKEQVSEIMKQYSKEYFSPSDSEPIFFYNDISLQIFFDDNNVVNELKFGNRYVGSTAKGLKIGDSLEKAIEIYGQPKMKSPKGAVWNKFAVFCEMNAIVAIRIQK